MFKKKTCERCGKQYRMRTISENKGKYLCHDCLKLCSTCSKKLPRSHYLGETSSITGALLGSNPREEFLKKPWIGSGLCNNCYWEEQELLKKAELKKAKEIMETPTVWTCKYCETVNRGNFCSNCGNSRKKS